MSRPEHLVLCVGTGTEVGKTWVGAATLSAALAAHLTAFIGESVHV